MKRLFFAVFIALAVLPLALSLFACGSSAPANSNYVVPEQQVTPAAAAPIVPASPPPPPAPVNPFYNGDGGKGTSLAILAPKTSGMEDADTVSTVIQGEFVSNFTSYTAISILDRASLDAQYTELLSGFYEDDAEAGLDLGHLPPTDYLLNTNITKTASGYALQIGITKTEDKMTLASYSGTCTMEELNNLTAIRQASLDLIEKMGVELSERTKTELAGAAAEEHIDAQTALAQGLNAQRSGTVVEALSRYIQANNYDPSLAEAASRLNILTANVTSGNIGEDVRNDLQWRDQWVARLKEAEDYQKKYLSEAIPHTIVYSTNITQGEIDYEKRSVPLGITLSLEPDYEWFSIINKVMDTVAEGLQTTGRAEIWKIELKRPREYLNAYYITVEIVNDAGKVIASETASLPYGWWFTTRRDPANPLCALMGSREVVFPAVNPNDITDNLSIRIPAIDGIPAEIAVAERNLAIVSAREYRGSNQGDVLTMEFDNSDTEYWDESEDVKYGYSKFCSNINVLDFGYKTVNDNFSSDRYEDQWHFGGIVYPPSVTSITRLARVQSRKWLVVLPSSVKTIPADVAFYNSNPTVLIGANDATILPADSSLAKMYNSNDKKPGYYVFDRENDKIIYSPCTFDGFDRR